MTLTTETKKGLVCVTLGLTLAWVIVYIINKEKKEEVAYQPIVTDDSIRVAVEAYKSGMDAGESKENLRGINDELKSEFGIYVEHKPLKGKFYVYDLSGKKVKEV